MTNTRSTKYEEIGEIKILDLELRWQQEKEAEEQRWQKEKVCEELRRYRNEKLTNNADKRKREGRQNENEALEIKQD